MKNQNNGGVVFLTKEAQRKHFQVKDIQGKIIGHPVIDKSQIREMMNNYRNYEQQFNNQLQALNIKVDEYNNNIVDFVQENNLAAEYVSDNEMFRYTYNHLSTKEYNQLVERANQTNKRFTIEKRSYKPLKQPHRDTFHAIIWKYGGDILRRNTKLTENGLSLSRQLEPVSIASNDFSLKDETGQQRINYSTKTIRNHVYRLREAGILFNYSFHGTKKAVNYHIHPDIFVIYDYKKRKSLTSENQLFIISIRKNFPDYNGNTSTRYSKEKIKEPVNNVNNALDKGDTPKNLAHHINSFLTKDFLQVHNSGNKDLKNTGAEKINIKTEFLRQLVEDENDLTRNLLQKEYSDYTENNHLSLFEAESVSGSMTKEEFRELLLQEFIKLFSIAWKNEKIYCWDDTWQLLKDEFLLNPNNSIPSKTTLFYQYKNLRLRMRYVLGYLKRTDFKLQPPVTYFDPTRKTKREGGFEFTVNHLKKLQANESQRHQRKLKRAYSAKKRNRKLNDQEKLYKAVNRLIKNDINYNQLIDYVEKNIPGMLGMVPVYIQNQYATKKYA
ncbi:hypothetical protein [Abyssalbus ytuae]|uniref:Uncharacterized protein n=1 Tax=Abyssalbus ytuae TaxID=2926907 RepID=A0A9E7D0P7_9FLAO|nr:hypothetical protein [Abyssalbus ytuae]UOB18610.1 hypothetical protein MQE35_04800 [Abyssalbus ytuae]